jgi:hypothetical protein
MVRDPVFFYNMSIILIIDLVRNIVVQGCLI